MYTCLTSPTKVGELTALSVSPGCLLVRGDHRGAVLWPSPSFVDKNIQNSFWQTVTQMEAVCGVQCPVSPSLGRCHVLGPRWPQIGLSPTVPI